MTADVVPAKKTLQPKLSPQDAFRLRWREPLDNPQSTLVNPYPGLRSFNVNESHIFRARLNQIRALRHAFAGVMASDEARHVVMVTGGSSSGKSSIVKAGLLADIHSLQMPAGDGNWYVAECRPVQSPVQELLHGLATMAVDAIFREVEGSGSRLAARVDDVLDAIDAPELDAATNARAGADIRARAMLRVRSLLNVRLWSARHVSEPASLAPALTLFVRETLDALDGQLHEFRAGPPRLLVSIDQFEEIFRCADGPQRDAVFGLIRFADQAVAQHATELYVVASMRSEELHRCSEFKGIADILNRSMHLVQLVLREDAELAIVEPGRLTLQGYGFPLDPDPNWPYTADAVKSIADAYDFASGTVEHRADALSLLQHFLRLLWDRSINQWVDGGDARLIIDSTCLSDIPGWNESAFVQSADVEDAADKTGEVQHRLASVLNCRADDVYERSIRAWCTAAGDSSERTKDLARSVLKAALVSLARRDDQRRVVRNWQTISDMLAVSVEAELFAQPGTTSAPSDPARFNARFEVPLAAALREFERATLIERRPDAGAGGRPGSDKYTVYHEAFIRNWAQYADWVRQAGKAADALRGIHEDLTQIRRAPPTPDGRNPEDVITVGQEADLSAVIGSPDESIEPVASTAADQHLGWASRAWAATEIARGVKSGDAIDASHVLADIRAARRGAIIARATLLELEARELKASAQVAEAKAEAARVSAMAAETEKRRTENYLKGAGVLIGVFAIMLFAVLWLYLQVRLNQDLVLISRLQKVGLEATEIAVDNPRTRQKDLDLWLVLTQLAEVGNTKPWWMLWRKGPSPEIVGQRAKALVQTANRARRALADLTVMPKTPGSFAEKLTEGAAIDGVECLPRKDGRGALPLRFRKIRDEKDKAPDTVSYSMDSSSLQYMIGDTKKLALYLNPKTTTVCFSRDATAILVMIEGEVQSSFVVLTDWNKIGNNWTALNSQPRNIVSRASQVLLARNPLRRDLTDEIKFFRKDNVLGFLVPTAPAAKTVADTSTDKSADMASSNAISVLWTNEGFSEPLSLGEQAWDGKPPVVDCKGRGVPDSMLCTIKGQSQATGEDFEATYITFEDKIRRQQCTNEAEFCPVNVKLSKDGEKLVEFTYQGRPPRNYALYSDFLWIQGDDNIVRKFDRRPDTAKGLLEKRWMDLCSLNDDERGDLSAEEREMKELPNFYKEAPGSFGNCKQKAATK